MKFKKVSPSCQGSLGLTSCLIFKILKALFTEKDVCMCPGAHLFLLPSTRATSVIK